MIKFKFKILYILLVLAIISCEEDTDRKYIDYKPVGGFVDNQYSTNATYIDESQQNVGVVLNYERMESVESVAITFNDLTTVPDTMIKAVSLIATEATITKDSLKMDLVKIDWSKVDPGQSFDIMTSIKEADNIEKNSVDFKATIKASKQAKPVLWLDKSKTFDAVLPFDQTGTEDISFEFEILKQPALQDIEIGIYYNDWYKPIEEGKFIVTQNKFVIPKGSTKIMYNAQLDGSKIPAGYSKKLWLELRYSNLADGILADIDGSNWTAILVGRHFPNISLNKAATLKALVGSNETGIVTFNYEIEILDHPAMNDIAIPLVGNDSNKPVEEGKLIIPDPMQLNVTQGSKKVTFTIQVDGSKFNSGESVKYWIELPETLPDGSNLERNSENFYTTILVGKA